MVNLLTIFVYPAKRYMRLVYPAKRYMRLVYRAKRYMRLLAYRAKCNLRCNHWRPCVQLGLLALVLAVSACTVGPKFSAPDITVPAEFDQAQDFNTGKFSTQTFAALNSPALDQLIAQSLVANTSIAQALARLNEARAYRGLSKYSLFPTVLANAEKTRSKTSDDDPQAPAGLGISDSYDAGFDASWEIDLFGSLRNQREALVFRTLAAEAAWVDMRRVMVAEVALGFFSALGTRERLSITERNLANLVEQERIATAILAAGRGTELDLSRAKSLRLSVAATVPQLRADLVRAEMRLATLTSYPVARVRELLDKQAWMPELPALSTIGKPEDWLARRPDVRAAWLNLRAQTHDVGTQIAEYFPKLTLLGSFGSVASTAGDLGSSNTDRWRFGPSLSWRFLDFGRVGQFVQAERAQAAGASAQYQEAVLQALEEIESALANFRALNEATTALTEAAIQAEKARALAELRFEAGASDYLVVLDAQRQRLSLDDQLALVKTARASALAHLYKALAGDFVERAQ